MKGNQVLGHYLKELKSRLVEVKRRFIELDYLIKAKTDKLLSLITLNRVCLLQE